MTSHEPLPAHLERIGEQLVAAARRPASSHRPRIAHPAVAAGTVALAAAVTGAVVIDSPAGESAWARETIRRAAAIVLPPPSPDTILHVAATETLSPLAQRDSGTTVSTLTVEAWIQQGPPWRERAITHTPTGPVLERDETGQIYNQTADTVYPAPQLPSGTPQYTLTPLGHGQYRLTTPLPSGGAAPPQTIDARTAQDLRDGIDQVEWSVGWDGHTQRIAPVVLPARGQLAQIQAQQPDPASQSFAAELRGLLDSGHARVTRTTTADGRPAIEIASVNPQSGPKTDYYVDPQTYAPIELDIFGNDSPADVTRVVFTTYETLPLAGNQQLLALAVPPSAQIDNTPADYWNSNLPSPF